MDGDINIYSLISSPNNSIVVSAMNTTDAMMLLLTSFVHTFGRVTRFEYQVSDGNYEACLYNESSNTYFGISNANSAVNSTMVVC